MKFCVLINEILLELFKILLNFKQILMNFDKIYWNCEKNWRISVKKNLKYNQNYINFRKFTEISFKFESFDFNKFSENF